MIRATIYLDGAPFSGVDLDGDDGQLSPAFRNGFHHTNHDGGSDALVFGGEPHVTAGRINIVGYLAKIIDRIERGVLSGQVIEVRMETVEAKVWRPR